jgi:nucleotide-binding universal stress UspA family protein
MVGHGDAASEIARIAQDEHFGLIVIATHGMTGWRNVQLGSVAERVVRLSTRPVLSIQTACRAA